MKIIEEKRKPVMKSFQKMKPGDVFKVATWYYIYLGNYNYIWLGEGGYISTNFNKYVLYEMVEAELVIKGRKEEE